MNFQLNTYLSEELTVLADQIITDQLNSEVMDSLVRRTRVVINCVGPYHLYSTPVVEACAKNGTHYVDVLVPQSHSMPVPC